MAPPTPLPLLLTGTYTVAPPPDATPEPRGLGIYAHTFDPDTGRLRPLSVTEGMANPSFLCPSADGTCVYAVNEVGEFAGSPGGGVSAFRLDRATGHLALLNTQPSHGADPCDITLDPTGRWVLVANYSGGNVAVYPVRRDGSLGAATDLTQHRGVGTDPGRQEKPHAHDVTFDATGRYVLVADLGLDRVVVYAFDPLAGTLRLAGGRDLPAGSGARQCAFHPDNTHVYVACELASTVSAYAFDASNGNLRYLQTLSTLPADFRGDSYVACIQVAPDGRTLYVSNRGHDSLAAFAIGADGTLTPVGHCPVGGTWPRHFTPSPDGRWLVVANQHSGNLGVLRAGADGGPPTLERGAGQAVPAAACVRFVG